MPDLELADAGLALVKDVVEDRPLNLPGLVQSMGGEASAGGGLRSVRLEAYGGLPSADVAGGPLSDETKIGLEADSAATGSRIVFLDFDGVISTFDTYLKEDAVNGIAALDRGAIARVNRLFQTEDEQTPVRAVIISSWRNEHPYSTLVEHLDHFGFDTTSLHEDWRTIAIPQGFRGDEVGDWLKNHPETRAYTILDDETNYYAQQARHQVRTSWDGGFRSEHLPIAQSVLKAGLIL